MFRNLKLLIANTLGDFFQEIFGLSDPDYLSHFAANKNQVLIGAILDLIGAGAFVGLAIMIFPVFKKHNENIALGYVVARSFEAVPFIIANISLLSLLTLSQKYVQAGASDASDYLPAGHRITGRL